MTKLFTGIIFNGWSLCGFDGVCRMAIYQLG